MRGTRRRYLAAAVAALCAGCSTAPVTPSRPSSTAGPSSTASSGTASSGTASSGTASSGTEPSSSLASSTAPSGTTTSAASSPGAPGPATSSGTGTATATGTDELTLAFGGDIHFAGPLESRLDHPRAALADLRPYLAAADVAVVNLETALTTRGSPAPKSFHFRAPRTALTALAAAGVDVASMANNHAVDYGAKGLADTLDARRTSALPVVGIGEDERDALRPAVVQARGRRVAVLAATQVPEWTAATWPARPDRPGVAVALRPERLAAAVRSARRTADVVVVYLHWGTDYTGCPNPLQRRTARALARAGADVVVGTHAHRVQGAGWLGRTYVGYGLGNFVWWRRNNELESRSGVLTLTVRGRRVVGERWTPMRVSKDGIPRVATKQESDRLQRAWRRSRGCTGLDSAPS